MTAVDDKHGSSSAGVVLLGVVALILAVAAAYLWLSDGAVAPPVRALPAPQAAQRIPTPPAAPARPKIARVDPTPATVAPAAPIPRTGAIRPPAAAPAPDPQIAADAAAVGLTSRVRPASADDQSTR